MESPEQPAPRQKHAGNTLQVLANVLTIFVALAAIGLSIWEGRENRRYNRLSVLPHLESSQEVLQEASKRRFTITYGLKNTGLGPAVIKNLYVYRDGTEIFEATTEGKLYSFSGFLDDVNALPFQVGSFVQSRGTGDLLAINDLHLLFRLHTPEADTVSEWPPAVVKKEVLDRYSFLFCYCSVYDEHCRDVTVGVAPPEHAQCSF